MSAGHNGNIKGKVVSSFWAWRTERNVAGAMLPTCPSVAACPRMALDRPQGRCGAGSSCPCALCAAAMRDDQCRALRGVSCERQGAGAAVLNLWPRGDTANSRGARSLFATRRRWGAFWNSPMLFDWISSAEILAVGNRSDCSTEKVHGTRRCPFSRSDVESLDDEALLSGNPWSTLRHCYSPLATSPWFASLQPGKLWIRSLNQPVRDRTCPLSDHHDST